MNKDREKSFEIWLDKQRINGELPTPPLPEIRAEGFGGPCMISDNDEAIKIHNYWLNKFNNRKRKK